MTRQQIGVVLGIVLLAIGIMLNAPLIFDALAPPAVTYDNPLRVISGPIHPGDTVTLRVGRSAWNITGSSPVPAEVSRQLVRSDENGNEIQPKQVLVLPSITLGVDPGHTVVQSRLSILPTDLPPGYWILEGEATARHKSSPYWSEPIVVLAP